MTEGAGIKYEYMLDCGYQNGIGMGMRVCWIVNTGIGNETHLETL